MIIRVRFDVVNSNGVVYHLTDGVNLPKWNAAEALKELKRRYPTAKSIKIIQHRLIE